MSNSNHFLVRRVHSLLGLIPIGIFLLFHLTLNIIATTNPARYA
ncbi:MAG: succinate dehydrogenase, partial [Peptococcaceae bacterium]|nr:succinate dehydrogenase [Peptococcaceae bacterium]